MRGQGPSLLERAVAGQDKLPCTRRRTIRAGRRTGHVAAAQVVRNVQAARRHVIIIAHNIRITIQRVVVAVVVYR